MKVVALFSLFALAASGQIARNLQYNGLSGEISGTCSVSYPIRGLIPPPGGRGAKGDRRVPVALYLPGTNEPFESRVGTAFIQRMESLGFASFVIGYPNRTDSGCRPISAKAACIFNPGPRAAISVIRAAVGPRVDTTRIVTAGISQGAQLAVIAGNGNMNVRAAWAIGVGNILSLGQSQIPMQGCMNASAHRLKSMEIFAANAANDQFFDVPSVNEELKGTTGNADCTNYHAANGSGCKVIAVSEFVAGSGHAYPFSDYRHWSTDTMIDWGLIHVSDWLCQMVACR